jgi:hypothetical protein
MIAWIVWFARNEVTHGKELPAVEGSKRFICSYMQSLENGRSMTPEQIVKGKHVMGLTVTTRQASSPPIGVVSWLRPPGGVLKLNVDGAFVAQSSLAGTTMILWLSNGSIVFFSCRALRQYSFALEAEMQACMEGLRFALDMSQEHIMVESDCSVLVQMALDKGRDGSALGHLVEDHCILLSSYQIVSFVKIPRLCNSSSHELAGFWMKNQKTQVRVGS